MWPSDVRNKDQRQYLVSLLENWIGLRYPRRFAICSGTIERYTHVSIKNLRIVGSSLDRISPQVFTQRDVYPNFGYHSKVGVYAKQPMAHSFSFHYGERGTPLIGSKDEDSSFTFPRYETATG